MRKLSTVLCLILLAGMLALSASAEGTYGEAPMLEKLVQQGQLPPVEERLPEHPKVSDEILDEYLDFEIGQYGGTLRLVTQVVNWDADAFVMCNEALLTMRSANSDRLRRISWKATRPARISGNSPSPCARGSGGPTANR